MLNEGFLPRHRVVADIGQHNHSVFVVNQFMTLSENFNVLQSLTKTNRNCGSSGLELSIYQFFHLFPVQVLDKFAGNDGLGLIVKGHQRKHIIRSQFIQQHQDGSFGEIDSALFLIRPLSSFSLFESSIHRPRNIQGDNQIDGLGSGLSILGTFNKKAQEVVADRKVLKIAVADS